MASTVGVGCVVECGVWVVVYENLKISPTLLCMLDIYTQLLPCCVAATFNSHQMKFFLNYPV